MISVDKQEQVFAAFRKECEKHGVIPENLTYRGPVTHLGVTRMEWTCVVRGMDWCHVSRLDDSDDWTSVEDQARLTCRKRK